MRVTETPHAARLFAQGLVCTTVAPHVVLFALLNLSDNVPEKKDLYAVDANKGLYSRTPQGGANLQRCAYTRSSKATAAECGRC